MPLGVPGGVPRDRGRRSVLGELVQDLVQQWSRGSHARALANARRAATAASAAGVERAEVDAWLRTQREADLDGAWDEGPSVVPGQRRDRSRDDDADEVQAGV